MSALDATFDSIEGSSAFLTRVLFALRQRRKALKHDVREIRIRQIAEGDGPVCPGLEIECVPSPRAIIRVQVWDDRWVWFDARQGSKARGWLWASTHQGRLFGADPERQLVQALEGSVAAAFQMTKANLARFEDIWRPLLAQGPRRVSDG